VDEDQVVTPRLADSRHHRLRSDGHRPSSHLHPPFVRGEDPDGLPSRRAKKTKSGVLNLVDRATARCGSISEPTTMLISPDDGEHAVA
jgi:hypothetical protein